MPEEADIPHVFEASRTPGFTDGMMWDPPATLDELRGPLARAQAGWHESSSYQFTIELLGEFAGRIALRPTDEPGVLDVGYWTHPRFWRQGVMTEALRAIVELAFLIMGGRAVVAGYASWNEGSRRVLESVGFRMVQIVPGAFVKGDRVWDDVHMRLDRESWPVR